MDDKINELIHNESLPLRMMGTFSLLFKGEVDESLLQLIDNEDAPESQKIVAIHQAGLRKRKNLSPILIGVVKNQPSSALALAAAQSLLKIVDVFADDLSSTSRMDLAEVCFNTTDIKLCATLHQLFVKQKQLPVFKVVAKTLMYRYRTLHIAHPQTWEVLARALHLCYAYHIQAFEKAIKKEEGKISHARDRERERIERQAVHIKGAIRLTLKVRDKLKKELAGMERSDAVTAALDSPALFKSFHEKCNIAAKLKPLIDGLVNTRPGIRSIASKELSHVYTPLAYEVYKDIILKGTNLHPDTIKNAVVILGTVAAKDNEAFETLTSLIPSFPQNSNKVLVESISKLCHNQELGYRIIMELIQFLKAWSLKEKLAQELVRHIFSENPYDEVVTFLLDVVEGRIPISQTVQKASFRVLVNLNRPEVPLQAKISSVLQRLSREGTTKETRQYIFQEIKDRPGEENISVLKITIFESEGEARKAALTSYFDLIKARMIEEEDAFEFLGSLLVDMTRIDQETKDSIIAFLKRTQIRGEALRGNIYPFLTHPEKQVRSAAYNLIQLWLRNPLDDAEGTEIVDIMLQILIDRDFPFDDIYLKCGKDINSCITDNPPFIEQHLHDMFIDLEKGLSLTHSSFHIDILSEVLDDAGNGPNVQARIHARTVMENLLKKPGVPSLVQLHMLQFLIYKDGRINQCFPRFLQLLHIEDPAIRKVALEILASEKSLFQKWSIEEKIDTLMKRKPGGVAEHIQWEVTINRDLLPILKKILSDPSSPEEIIALAITIMRRIECARLEAPLLFRFQQGEYGDAIRERSLESLAYLLYKPFNSEENEIIEELKSVAENTILAANYRLSALLALVNIGSDEFYDFFITFVKDGQERNDVRLLAIRGLNALRNMKAMEIYLPALAFPWFSKIEKEIILDGLATFSHSAMIDPLLQLMFTEENQKLVEKAEFALTESGYAQAIEIRAGYEELKLKQKEIEEFKEKIENSKEKAATLTEQLDKARIEIRQISDKIADNKNSMQQEEDRKNSAMEDWEKKKNAMDARMREYIPGWPQNMTATGELKEQYIREKQNYDEFMGSYMRSMNECLYTVEGLKKDHEKLQAAMDVAYERADRIKEKLVPFLTEETKAQESITCIQTFIGERLKELKAAEAAFREKIPLMDMQNKERVRSYWHQRITEWNNRWKYYHALKSMAGLAPPQGQVPPQGQAPQQGQVPPQSLVPPQGT